MSDTQPTDGGPAFGHGSPGHGGDPGMSLRDYFACHAMAGQIASPNLNPAWVKKTGREEQVTTLAVDAYRMADAMLEARTRA